MRVIKTYSSRKSWNSFWHRTPTSSFTRICPTFTSATSILLVVTLVFIYKFDKMGISLGSFSFNVKNRRNSTEQVTDQVNINEKPREITLS